MRLREQPAGKFVVTLRNGIRRPIVDRYSAAAIAANDSAV
jgi:hypothetical protein